LKYEIYVSKNGERIGPFTKKELREAIHSGRVSWDDLAWHKDLSEWKPVLAVIPIIHVARSGEEIGTFENESEILSGLRDGTLLMGDYYWCEGMSEWKHLSTLEISRNALATTAQKDALKRAGLPFDDLTTKVQVSAAFWSGGPATENQKASLNTFGITVPEGLTKREASGLIDRAKVDPLALETQEKFFLEQRRIQTQYPSYHLKQMIASATKDLEEAKKEKREAKALLKRKNEELDVAKKKRASATDEFEQLSLDTEIKDLEDEASQAEEAFDTICVEEAKDELRYETGLRIKFWKATFNYAGIGALSPEDVEGLLDYADTAERRYNEFGCRFKVPTNTQIAKVVDALDEQFPEWDKTQPEQFYPTLAAFFPHLRSEKCVRLQVPTSGVGCLVVLSGCLLLYYVLTQFA
jgi:GYF domain 2